MCAHKEKEEKHEQETVNAHGEDSSENRLIIMGRLKLLKVYRLQSYLMNGEKSNLSSAVLKRAGEGQSGYAQYLV